MTKKSSSQQQPRAVSPDLAIQPYFRAGLNLELQKFGDNDRRNQARQLVFGETDSQELDNTPIDTYGLDLTVSEDRAVHAIQVLLDKTNYQGNMPGQVINSSAYNYQGTVPILSITYTEYFEAYGLDKRGDQYYRGNQAQEALDALKSLTKARVIIYVRTKRGQRNDVIRTIRALIEIVEGFQNLTEEETARITRGEDLPNKRKTKLIIKVSPLWVDQIETFYLLKPVGLHNEIKQITGSKRQSRSTSLFCEWLMTKNTKTVRISKQTLAEKLRLEKLIEQRKKKILDTRFQEAFQIAKELGYLLDYREEPTGLLVFTLNSERCQRVASDKIEEEL